MRYKIIVTEDYEVDLDNLYHIICEEYKSPITAKKYLEGLIDTVEKLCVVAGALPYCRNSYVVEKYGLFVKRINYKKMAVLFEIDNDIVFILRILPQSVIY